MVFITSVLCRCLVPMREIARTDVTDGVSWYCPHCKSRKSIRDGIFFFKEPHHLAEVDDTDTLLDCSRECHFSSKKFRDQYGYSYKCLPVVAGSLFTKAYP